jgi:hypothetical protein
MTITLDSNQLLLGLLILSFFSFEKHDETSVTSSLVLTISSKVQLSDPGLYTK